jgi:hypothetical protein
MRTTRNPFLHPFISAGKFFSLFLVITGLMFTAISCSDDDEEPVVTDEFTATLSGANENPPNESTASGTANLTYNKDTRIFEIVVEYTGIEAIGAHIHIGAEDVHGPVVFGFNPPASPINYTSEPLSTQQESDLYDGLYYVNIHSQEYPAGEIRGQLIQE